MSALVSARRAPTSEASRVSLLRRVRALAAFTLIEVLAAVLLTSIVLTVAVSIFINISDATTTATARMRETRHAVSILDRIAHDLESAFLLVKPGEMDPLDHPWLFLGESEYSDASDRLKFVIRSRKTGTSTGHASDLAMVTYALVEDDFDSFVLVRSASPDLPERLNLDIPLDEEDGAMLLAEGVESFSVRFLGEGGEWVDQWNSSQMIDSGGLPLAAEISISFADPDAAVRDLDSLPLDFQESEEAYLYTRRVVMPMRPVPIQQIVADYVEIVRGGGDPNDPKNRNNKSGTGKPTEEFQSGCQGTMSYAECAERNRGRLLDGLGSSEAVDDCIARQKRTCVGEEVNGRSFYPSSICGVAVQCR